MNCRGTKLKPHESYVIAVCCNYARLIVAKFTSSEETRRKLWLACTLMSSNIVFCAEADFALKSASLKRRGTFQSFALFNRDYLFFVHHARCGSTISACTTHCHRTRHHQDVLVVTPRCCVWHGHSLQVTLQSFCCVPSSAAASPKFVTSARWRPSPQCLAIPYHRRYRYWSWPGHGKSCVPLHPAL
jgi:hypothetical protein